MNTARLSIYALAFGLILSACGGNVSDKQREENATETKTESISHDSSAFNLENLPISEVDLGEFPYLAPPENYCFDFCQDWKGGAGAKARWKAKTCSKMLANCFFFKLTLIVNLAVWGTGA